MSMIRSAATRLIKQAAGGSVAGAINPAQPVQAAQPVQPAPVSPVAQVARRMVQPLSPRGMRGTQLQPGAQPNDMIKPNHARRGRLY